MATLFRAASVSGHVEVRRRSEAFPAYSLRIRHRSTLTEKALENVVQGLGNYCNSCYTIIAQTIRSENHYRGRGSQEINTAILTTRLTYQKRLH